MGYRVSVGKIAKKNQEIYKGKTKEEVRNEFGEDDGSGYIYYNFATPEGYEYLESVSGIIYKDKETWKNFYDFEVHERMECEFYILSKENLKNMIDQLTKEVQEYYESIYQEFDTDKGQSRALNAIFSKKNDWTTTFYNHLCFDKEDLRTSKSESLEYIVLNLVNIYKMFDWENNYLVFSGW